MIYVNLEMSVTEDHSKIQSIIGEFETSKVAKTHFINAIAKSELVSNVRAQHIFQHENYHYWQSLFYPFLYLIGIIEFRNILIIAEEIRNSEKQEIAFNDFHLSAKSNLNLRYLVIEFKLVWINSELTIISSDEETSSLNVSLSLNDLIEDSASIYEFRLINEKKDGNDYNLWLKNPANNSYKKLFRFLEKIIGSENSFNVLPMLVQLAFYTTEPVGGFCNAFNYWWKKNGLLSHVFIPTLKDYLTLKDLMRFSYPKADFNLENLQEINKMPVTFISVDILNKIIKYDFATYSNVSYYPLSFHFSKLYSLVKTNPLIEGALFEPTSVGFLLKEFEPFGIHVYLLDLHGRNSYIIVGKDFQNIKVLEDKVNFDLYLKEVIKMISITLSLTSDFQSDLPHNCHHVDCSYYELNNCRKWNSIPNKYQDCRFPFWFGWYFNYRIDIPSKKYIRLNKSEVARVSKEYFEKMNMPQNYDYLFYEGEYVFTINRQHILEDSSGNRFKKFLKFLCEKEEKEMQFFFQKIMFDFYSFDGDKREIFEIPEIIKWFKKIKKVTPDLFLYLNFDRESDARKSLFLPIFIKYTKEIIGENYQIRLDPQNLTVFVKQEFLLLLKISEEKKYNLDKVLSILKNLFFPNDDNKI